MTMNHDSASSKPCVSCDGQAGGLFWRIVVGPNCADCWIAEVAA